MKRLLFIIGALLITNIILCQNILPPKPRDISKTKIIDQSNLRITYSLDFKYSEQTKEYNKDTRVVLVGDRIIKDYSYIVYSFDSTLTVMSKRGAHGVPMLQQIIYPYEIYNNYETGKTLLTYRTLGDGTILRFFDNQPLFKWELKEGYKTILGYKCQQATTRFAGRDYTAWFTMEIPVDAGPYKFNGLPGLILKVEESTGFFVWTAIGISRNNEPIVEYELNKYQNCTRKQADETIKRMFASPISFINSSGAKVMTYGKDGNLVEITTVNEIPIPYEPLER